jgi:4-hydroxythreonine-4-phosphate dehydrogenase
MDLPVIAITMGDPAGIGPELIVKVLTKNSVHTRCRPIVIGDARVIQDACALLGAGIEVRTVESPSGASFSPGAVEVVAPEELRVATVVPGNVDEATGKAAAVCLETAYTLGAAGAVHGVVSAPMNKQAFHLAGYGYFDEVDYLAELTNSRDTMLFGVISPSLWTVAVTVHVPFRKIADLITRDRVVRHLRRLHGVLEAIGLAGPRIAVAALNVHGGEGGLFGREEIEEIAPAICETRAQGINATGPHPADTVFVRARAGEFDGVVCMYHDQANIARKLLATWSGATLVVGLPVVWGTTAHGTALDKAGKGMGNPGSLEAAVTYTAMLASRGIR